MIAPVPERSIASPYKVDAPAGGRAEVPPCDRYVASRDVDRHVSALLLATLLLPGIAGAQTPPEAPVGDSLSFLVEADRSGRHPTIRYEWIGPEGSPQVEEHFKAAAPLVDALLDATTSEADRQSLRRDVGVLPIGLLQRANDAGVRIWVAPNDARAIPARFFAKDTDPAAIKSANDAFAKEDNAGLFVPVAKLITVRQADVPDPSPAAFVSRIVVHEFGHAAQYLVEADPVAGPAHAARLERIHREDMAADPPTVVTRYAKTNSTEHYAEAFESWFTAWRFDGTEHDSTEDGDGEYASLKARDPKMEALIADDVRWFNK